MSIKEKAEAVIREGFEANQVTTMVGLLERKKKLQEKLVDIEKDMIVVETATCDQQLMSIHGKGRNEY